MQSHTSVKPQGTPTERPEFCVLEQGNEYGAKLRSKRPDFMTLKIPVSTYWKIWYTFNFLYFQLVDQDQWCTLFNYTVLVSIFFWTICYLENYSAFILTHIQAFSDYMLNFRRKQPHIPPNATHHRYNSHTMNICTKNFTVH